MSSLLFACFLTTTKPAATKTAIVTKTKPAVTHTVYKIGGPRKVIFRTITICRYKAGPTLSAPETTTTTTATIIQTDHTLTTVIDSQTTTATETDDVIDSVTQTKTETATATATKSPCGDAANFTPMNEALSSSNIQLTLDRGVSGATADWEWLLRGLYY
ncbi:hypothetical protein Forpi1262_v015692 [Fusarium oxysporum f. sp. raphani]|uniref:Uncharacterized protein n=1 Tax=Fusarium oxysporum f. sp. raphani TaxID=96318 RepID=A0A8J5PRR8_FUSOX|nr:hypothetical protein Forpi1262_v015692 [Fusarium oxysporum f. sp. raphani]